MKTINPDQYPVESGKHSKLSQHDKNMLLFWNEQQLSNR